MGGLSWWHWLIIGAAFILLFGAKKLPDAARGIGRSLRILKAEVSAIDDDEQATPARATDSPAIVTPGSAAASTGPTNPAAVPTTPAAAPRYS